MSTWFESWFDTHYYHTLYKNRSFSEAEQFIDNLILHLNPKPGAQVLDLACGKGRHSVYLHAKGLNVLGVDLSANSIQQAKPFEKEGLQFEVHDMRESLPQRFDYIFNLFTSFGYFENDEEDVKVLTSIHTMLNDNGLFVFDFFNAQKVIANLVPSENKEIEGIRFEIRREVQQGKIRKYIRVLEGEKQFDFQESVRAYRLEELESMFSATKLQILAKFGDYSLQPFEAENSDRLILIAQHV